LIKVESMSNAANAKSFSRNGSSMPWIVRPRRNRQPAPAKPRRQRCRQPLIIRPRHIAPAQPGVRDVGRVLSMYVGPDDALVTMDLDFDAGPLRGTFGTQNYELPIELDLSQYGSVVIYSPSLDTIYSIAPLVLFA